MRLMFSILFVGNVPRWWPVETFSAADEFFIRATESKIKSFFVFFEKKIQMGFFRKFVINRNNE